MLAQSVRAAGAICMLSSMLLAHAENAPSNETWAPSSNGTNSTTTAAAHTEGGSYIWLLGIFLEIVATFVGTAGKQCVRYSTILAEKKVCPCVRWTWAAEFAPASCCKWTSRRGLPVIAARED